MLKNTEGKFLSVGDNKSIQWVDATGRATVVYAESQGFESILTDDADEDTA